MNRLPKILQLQRDNSAAPRAFRAEVAGDDVKLYMYDVIGYDWWTDGGVTAAAFAEALAGITAGTIHLHIDSPGGDVFEARAITSLMDQHPAKFVAHIDGLAASAASFIAVRCEEVIMGKGTMMMIHNAWSLTIGDHRDMTASAGLLQKIDGTIASDYVAKSGKDLAEVVDLMANETWFTADEAVDAGFANSVAAGKQASTSNLWNLSAYANAPKRAPAEDIDAKATAHFNTLQRRFALLERTPA